MNLSKYKKAQGDAFKAINELFTSVSMGWVSQVDRDLEVVRQATEKMKRYSKKEKS